VFFWEYVGNAGCLNTVDACQQDVVGYVISGRSFIASAHLLPLFVSHLGLFAAEDEDFDVDLDDRRRFKQAGFSDEEDDDGLVKACKPAWLTKQGFGILAEQVSGRKCSFCDGVIVWAAQGSIDGTLTGCLGRRLGRRGEKGHGRSSERARAASKDEKEDNKAGTYMLPPLSRLKTCWLMFQCN
jgi:hypothetical protein